MAASKQETGLLHVIRAIIPWISGQLQRTVGKATTFARGSARRPD
jgi:hypothetical protein